VRRFKTRPTYADSIQAPAELKTASYNSKNGDVTELAGKTGSLGDKNGWWQEFKNHRVVSEKLWDHNRLVQERRFSNGILYNVIVYRLKGTASIEVSVTGAPIRGITLSDNTLHGTYQEWDVDGNIFLEAEFRKGLLHGIVKFYWASGELQSSCKFSRGEKVGHERSFYENGKIKASVEYRDGKRKGWCYHWDPEGLHLASFLWTRNHYSEDSRGSRANITQFNAEIMKSLFEPLLGHFRLSKHRDAQKSFRPQTQISSFYERLEVSKTIMRPLNEVPACV
jgi:hypothetical protein